MKNKVAIIVLAVLVAVSFALGVSGLVKPVMKEKEKEEYVVDRPIGYLIIRSDAPAFEKEEDGTVKARAEKIVPEDGSMPYMDYVFDIPRSYSIYEYKYVNVFYMHADPVFAIPETKSKIDLSQYDDGAREAIAFEVTLPVTLDASVFYFVNTVYQKADGDVYAVLSDADLLVLPDITIGGKMTVTYENKVNVDSDDGWNEYISKMEIELKSGSVAEKIRITEFDKDGKELKRSEETSSSFSDKAYTPDDNCEYMFLEYKIGDSVHRDLIEKGETDMFVPAKEEDGIILQACQEILWKAD
ncbi:MAG: hypothetical protein J5752_10860 [Clostridiales bacterium]|nr:hypothetical protein [Clostridiales bacterium]